jgi:hypothetical protein
MNETQRITTGVPGLDRHLGGGLIPGSLTAIVGATGIGKTQFGLQFAHGSDPAQTPPGIVFDMSYRGDAQGHQAYARRMFDWSLIEIDPTRPLDLDRFFAVDRIDGQYLHVFDYSGRKLRQSEVDWDQWRQWQAELVSKLATTIAFFYGNFVRGVRRVVIDGVDPSNTPAESIQFELFEYIYQQILRKDPDWVARDLFREKFRAHAAAIEQHAYLPQQITCAMLYTSHEMMLDDLIGRPLQEGDWLANANTVIYLGKVREGTRLRKALYVAKHRGSRCAEEILPYEIDDAGLRLES